MTDTDFAETPASAEEEQGGQPSDGEATAQRERSTIRFPYGDMDDAEAVARAINAEHGTGCDLSQLAAALGQTVSSSAFRTKVYTAQNFGVVTLRQQRVTLTDLGHRIADPATQASARVEAFLHVPLYLRLFTEWDGKLLPGDRGLEAEMVKAGVVPKQVARARQAFQRSAEVAGFFKAGRDRLVKPPIRDGAASAAPVEQVVPSGGELPPMAQHPLIVGLLAKLPPDGGTYELPKLDRWLATLRANLMLIYDVSEEPPGPNRFGASVESHPHS